MVYGDLLWLFTLIFSLVIWHCTIPACGLCTALLKVRQEGEVKGTSVALKETSVACLCVTRRGMCRWRRNHKQDKLIMKHTSRPKQSHAQIKQKKQQTNQNRAPQRNPRVPCHDAGSFQKPDFFNR